MEFVEYEQTDRIVTIRMNRPERLNAVGAQLRADLAEAWARFMADDDAWVAILTGNGRIFCAGRDLKDEAEARARGERPDNSLPAIFNYYHMPDTEKPIIAAVNGGAWGYGWFMACGSDIVIAAEDARFAMAELPTGAIGPAPVPLLNNIPWIPGSEIVLRGHQISAQRAYELGFVGHVVAPDELMPTAMEIAQEMAALPPLHVQATKRLLMLARPRPTSYQEQVALKQTRAGLRDLEDSKEGSRAFAEKRKPIFQGR